MWSLNYIILDTYKRINVALLSYKAYKVQINEAIIKHKQTS